MKLDVPYGREGRMPLEVPDDIACELVLPKEVPPLDEHAALRSALDAPLGGTRLAEFLHGAHNVLVIVNDATRPTPTTMMLDAVAGPLNEANARFIVAVGTHRAPTEKEYREIFGVHYEDVRGRLLQHDCRNDADIRDFGTTTLGTPIRVNKAVAEADRIVILTSVEPHYFAGCTGGRKSIFPGLAAHASITQNHKWALDERSSTFALKGNPVHDDMDEAVRRLDKPIFALQAVLDSHYRVCAAFAGDNHASFQAAVDRAHDLFAVGVPRRADIVVAVARYPLDIDLYQAQKSLENARHAVRKGGVLILVAECREAIGNDTFYRLLTASPDLDAVFDAIDRGYQLGFHKAAKAVELLRHCDVFAVTAMENETLEKIFVRPFATVQEAFDRALAEKGREASVLVLMDATLTVPVPASGI